jgi:hypothetical protein
MSPLIELIGGAKVYGWGSFAGSGSLDSIATVTVGAGGSANIEFTSIPSAYKHLQIRISAQSNRGTFGSDYNNTTINNDTGSNYARHTMGGDGSSSLVGATANGSYVSGGVCGTSTGGTFGTSIIDILDYTNTNKFKTVRVLSGNDLNGSVGGYPGEMYLLSGLWMNTNAVTSIKFVPNSGTLYTQHTKFALYGMKGQ